MAILDIFKKKKKEISKEKAEKEKELKKVAISPQKPSFPDRKGIETYRILKSPHITEKASFVAEENKYIFKVFQDANKIDIKKAVSDIYNVDVKSVKIVKIPKKKKRLGRIEGYKKGYKKAIVTLKEGQKIEILPR